MGVPKMQSRYENDASQLPSIRALSAVARGRFGSATGCPLFVRVAVTRFMGLAQTISFETFKPY